MAFTLLSPAFLDGEALPTRFTCDGEEHSPELAWGDAPAGTRSLALIMHDRDAPGGDFTHWILFNIPDDAIRIPESTVPDRIGEPATNDYEVLGYSGPCPPPGDGPHRYLITLFALDTDVLPLGPTARRAEVDEALRGHILEQAVLQTTYRRP